MSHFTVLVIGDDYEGQLAPFDEEIRVEPYRSYEHDTEWLYRVYESEVPEGERPTIEALIEWLNVRWEEEDNPYAIDELGVYRMSTYNPSSKWDWHTVGGRWTGYFKLTQAALDNVETEAALGRPGTFGNEPTHDADVVRRGDVDAEAMRATRGDAAGSRWDRAHALFEGLEEADSWQAVRERNGENHEAARNEYHEQPRVMAAREHDEQARKEERHEDVLLGWSDGVEEFQVSREQYVQQARDHAICPYAYLHEGVWFAPGEMGWWGMSTDTEEDSARFAREFNELFDSLPDDTVLTLVDCHI